MQITIRPARVTDVKAIFHVRTSVNENVLSVPQLAELGITEAAIIQMLQTSPCCWVACDVDCVVGFSLIDMDAAALFAAFVLPSHEGCGVGRQIVQCAEDALFRRHDVIWLETAKSSRAAGFYRHLGWAATENVGLDDVRMEKRNPLR